MLAGTATDYLAAENAPSSRAALLVAVGRGAVLRRCGRCSSRRSPSRRAAGGGPPGGEPGWCASPPVPRRQRPAHRVGCRGRLLRHPDPGVGARARLAPRPGRAPRLAPARAGPARGRSRWAGLGLIGYAVVTFDGSTAFPGSPRWCPRWEPSSSSRRTSTASGGLRGGSLGARPSQQLGDVSYSVYLWHWPVVVLVPYALTREMTNVEKVVAVAAVIAVSVLTKRFVEDPVRRSRRLSASLPRTFAILAASVLVLGAAGVGIVRHADAADGGRAAGAGRRAPSSDCVGAEATRNAACPSVTGDSLLSTPSVARIDQPVVYADGCWSTGPSPRARSAPTATRPGRCASRSWATRTPATGSPRSHRWPRNGAGASTPTSSRSATA